VIDFAIYMAFYMQTAGKRGNIIAIEKNRRQNIIAIQRDKSKSAALKGKRQYL